MNVIHQERRVARGPDRYGERTKAVGNRFPSGFDVRFFASPCREECCQSLGCRQAVKRFRLIVGEEPPSDCLGRNIRIDPFDIHPNAAGAANGDRGPIPGVGEAERR